MLKTGAPRHEQLSDWLRSQIQSGVYKLDDQLPSESRLGAQFGVSRITVRQALQTLEYEGLIYRKQGLGSFVQGRPVQHGLVHLTDFVEDMAQAGLEARSRITFQGVTPAPADVAQLLGVADKNNVICLDRLRLGDGRPVAFDRSWLPMHYGQVLEGLDLENQTLYGIMERECGVPVLEGVYRISAANADAPVADALEIREGQAVLMIDRIALTSEKRCLYVQRRWYRTDRVVYELHLKRSPGASAISGGMPLTDFEPVFRRDTEAPQ